MGSERAKTPGDDGDHVVLKFRPRTTGTLPPSAGTGDKPAAPPDLSSYDRSREPEDYRHRTLVNLAGLGITVALTAFGIWLATEIADLRRTQDCILVGRRDCGSVLPAAPLLPPPGG